MRLSKLLNSKPLLLIKKFFFGFIFKFFRNNPDQGQKQDFDKKLVYSLAQAKIPTLSQIKYIKKLLTDKELWIIRFCFIIIILSVGFLGTEFYFSHIKIVPGDGGEYIEGLVGFPKYINPLYANYSDVDSDISSLVFSSIVKRNKDGQLVNDLAKNYEIRESGKEHIFKIRKDVKWHNGEALTVDDIIFTFNTFKDNKFRSPLESSFKGVEIEKIDDETIKFILKEPYAAFLEILTFGIMPRSAWSQISPHAAGLAELNLKPIGSGPYKFKSFSKDKNGQIGSYTLVLNKDYYGSKPHIENINFKFFASVEEIEQAAKDKKIEGVNYLARQENSDSLFSSDQFNFYKLNFAELKGLFFNSANNPALSDKKVRQALALAINKNEIVNNVLNNGARLIDGPILPDNFAYWTSGMKFQQAEAVKLLEEAGWQSREISPDDIKKSEIDKNSTDIKVSKEAESRLFLGAGKWRAKNSEYLIIKLTGAQNSENKKVTAALKNFWEGVGIKTKIEMVEASEIRASIIRPRSFEVLLYGQIVGSDPDCYVFWHSLEAGESGYNFSNYANKEADKLLEEGRIALNLDVRKDIYKKFQEIITLDVPAIYLYSPFYNYAQSKKIKGFDVKYIYLPQDRFNNISEWYVKTEKRLSGSFLTAAKWVSGGTGIRACFRSMWSNPWRFNSSLTH